MKAVITGVCGAAMLLFALAPLSAAPMRPSAVASFPLGGSGGVICTAQAADADPVLGGPFDRGYSVVCRDAALPVAKLYALRGRGDDVVARLDKARADKVRCGAARQARVEDVGDAEILDCKLTSADVAYRVYRWRTARGVYVAEGLTGYDSALTIGLRTLVADRPVKGDVTVASTSAGDPAAFARLQAGQLSAGQAVAEGYRRNNSGEYAEAAEFFASFANRGATEGDAALANESLVNRALQSSNLGMFDQSAVLFDQADRLPTSDPLQLRLRRNFRALDLLNQGKPADAQKVLERPIAAIQTAGARSGRAGVAEIDAATAATLNASSTTATRFGGDADLSPAERGLLLDAQASQLHGTAARLLGNLAGAEADQRTAIAEIMAVRGGRLGATARLQAQVLAEQSKIAEARGDQATAEALLRRSFALIEQHYPRSVSSRSAQARLAAYLARHGRPDEALTLFHEVVAAAAAGDGAGVASSTLAPYFDLLAAQIKTRPALVTDMFLASQTTARPGVAATQSILARELSAGNGDAARLFRQSVNLSRDVERARVELAALTMVPQPQAAQRARAETVKTELDRLSEQQTETQARLADFAQYRVVSRQALTLADLQAKLHGDEGYLKLASVDDAIYVIYATRKDAIAYKAAIGAAALESAVDKLRNTVVVEENGKDVTYPFDLKLSRAIFLALFQPVEARLGTVKHLVFEPDGGMLRLPANLLVVDQPSVDAYYARQAKPGADAYDFRGVQWLGRRLGVTTAVSARAFSDVRSTPPSKGKEQYLGLGQNAPVTALASLPASRAVSGAGAIDCNYPLDAWNHPIMADELATASKIVGKGGAEVITGAQFSDTSVIGKKDLDQFRVLHFATHGLVKGPLPGCPAQPALLTSFGGATSDGLLTFREIYDLRIDADLVILSACDTAAGASVAATRAAGITGGGGFALDGLVRAFVGAGGRTVIASHWPVPNQFNATERLISGLFDAPAGTATEAALRSAQLTLMDQADTSHPFYWAAFAIIGDGESPVLKKR